MEFTSENFLLIGSVLLFISLIAGKTSYKFGVPTLLFFILVGILAGSEGLGRIYFDNPKVAQIIGIIALNFILFSGGLSTKLKDIKPVLWEGLTLSTLGVFITAVSIGIFAHILMNFSIIEGMLLGAIISSTDSAAVFSLLRAKSLGLKDNLKPLLELESGSNDPMAYFLTVTFLGIITTKNSNMISIIPMFFLQLLIGLGFGILFGKLSKVILNKIKLEYGGLYFVLTIAIMFFSFSFANFIKGNGFLSVYITALILGNSKFIHKNSILKTFDGFSWLMQIVLFLTLGLLVFPSHILPIIGVGSLLSFFLIFIARPVSVFLCLAFFKTKLKSKLFISWVGLRGAVPIVFATYPMILNLNQAQMIFNIVFFISTISLIIQGTSIPFVAKLLKVDLICEEQPEGTFDKFLNEDEKSVFKEIKLKANSPMVNKSIVDINLPKNVIIALVSRDNKYIIPDGNTVLLSGDIIMLLAENKKDVNEALTLLK